MKDLAAFALDSAVKAGASYADIRLIDARHQSISTNNGDVTQVEDGRSQGFGVRVLADGAWGFAASTSLTNDGVAEVATRAVALAKASALLAIEPVELAGSAAHQAEWSSPVQEDPFRVGLDEKTALLLRIDRALRSRSEIQSADGRMTFSHELKHFGSTEGAWIIQERTVSGVGYSATAVGPAGVQTRSYPSGPWGTQATGGYEFIRQWPLVAAADRVAGEAVSLLEAAPCPSGELDLILDSSQVARQVRETCGVPTELDRVLGWESNGAGGSFLSTDKLATYRFGSDAVTLVADPTAPGGLGSYGFDDEGVAAARWDLVRSGTLVGYLTSRQTAPLVGQSRSQGACRAASWADVPLVRMTNVSLEPGEGSLEDLVADTKRGVLMEASRATAVDGLRYGFRFGCELGWEIENGRRKRLVRNPSYSGNTPGLWRSCDHICGREEWRLWGIPGGRKGVPSQTLGSGHGASPARFRSVRVGPTRGRKR